MTDQGVDKGTQAGSSEFERRTRELLLQSAEQLPGAVRSRLTQARYAALAAHAPSQSTPRFRRWMPAGAVAGVALALFMVLAPHGTGPTHVAMTGPALEDIDLLTDSDALPLSSDQDVDDDFYEWAAGEAAGGSASAIGS
jgi:hypothetical protein